MIGKKFKAFTLAEVLITLGIIGVVAALTIPTVIQNYQKKVTVERLKSTYSILAQAIKMSEIDNGVVSEWELPISAEPNLMQAYAEKYFIPYLKNVKQCYGYFSHCFADTYYFINKEIVPETSRGYSIMLNNGVALTIYPQKESNVTSFTVDINGRKNPNTIGKDTFDFILKHGEYDNWGLGIDRPIGTLSAMGQGNTNTSLKNAGNMGCSKNNEVRNAGRLCGAWIIQNGWEIPDDYPW